MLKILQARLQQYMNQELPDVQAAFRKGRGTSKNVSTGEGNGKPLQYSCLENLMNSMKRQKDRTLKDGLPRSVGAQYATENSGEIIPQRIKRQSQSKTKPTCGCDR